MDLMDLVAKLTMDSSDYESGLSKVQKGAKTAFNAVGAAIAAGTTAVVGFGASSVKVGMDFDKSMSQVAATLGLSTQEMETQVGKTDTAYGKFEGTLREFAQFMGANTAFSATQAADALNYMALAGYKTQESMTMLPNVLNLAAAGAMDLATASDMVTDVQTAFGLKTEEMPQLVDEMAKAASTGNTSVQQLGEAFLVVGGLAQELNGGFVTLADGTKAPVSGMQEMEIALTAMANAGVKGSSAGTHMRNMIMKLSSPTKEGAEQMEALGVKVFDAEGNMRSLADIMGDLSVALSGVTQEQKIQAISDLFNARDLASAEALLNATNQDWNKIGASILDADGAAQKMADTQLDNLAGDVTMFKSALEGAQIVISDQLTPTLRNFVQFGTDGLSRLTQAFLQDGLGGAMDELGSILSDFIAMISEELPKIVEAGSKLVMSLLEGIIANLPKLAEAAVKMVTTLANGLAERLPQLMETMAEVVTQLVSTLSNPDTLSGLLEAGLNIILALADGIMKAVPKLLEALPELIHNIIEFLIGAIPQIAEAGFKLFASIVENLPDVITSIVQLLPDLITGIVTGLLDGIPRMIEAGIKLFSSIVSDLPSIIENIIKAVPKIIAGLAEGFAGNSGKLLESGIKLIEALISGMVKSIPLLIQVGPQLVKGIAQGIIGSVQVIIDAAKNIGNKIKETFQNIINNAKQWGADLIKNFTGGISSSLGGLWNTVSGIAGKIKSFLGFSEPEEGPLSDFHTYAPDMMKLFAKGIKDNEHLVTDQIRSSFDFGNLGTAAAPALAGGSGSTTNTYNITVNGIEELEELLQWYQSRQVRARMA